MTRQFITFLIITLTGGLMFSSCRDGEKGDPGPAGVGYYKTDNGELSGTIYYSYPNGDTAIVPFSNKGYSSSSDNLIYIDTSGFYGYYYFSINRTDPADDKSFIRIMACGYNYFTKGADSPYVKPYNLQFGISKIQSSNGNFFAFATMNDLYNYNYYYDIIQLNEGSNLTISNYYLNPANLRLTFDYEIVIDPANDMINNYITSTTYPPVIKGRVDVTLKRSDYFLQDCNIAL